MTKKKIFFAITTGLEILLVILLLALMGLRGSQEPPIQETLPIPTTTVPVPTETVSAEAVQPPPAVNPYTAADFGYQEDGYMTCLTAPSIRGIDVSQFQKQVDWAQVKAAGFEFVFIRVAGRGYGQSGKLYADSMAQKHYDGAKAAGLQVGCYFFSQAINTAEAIEEAEYMLELTKDWELELPMVYDWECLAEDYRTINVTARELTDCTKAFCERLKEAGKTPMIYFNTKQSFKSMYLEELTEYPFWLASYSGQMEYPYKVDYWQYTNQGSVPGIPGNADINLMFPTPILNLPEGQ